MTEIEGLGVPLVSWLQDPLVTQIWRTELDTVAEATEDSKSALVRLRSSEICKPSSWLLWGQWATATGMATLLCPSDQPGKLTPAGLSKVVLLKTAGKPLAHMKAPQTSSKENYSPAGS